MIGNRALLLIAVAIEMVRRSSTAAGRPQTQSTRNWAATEIIP